MFPPLLVVCALLPPAVLFKYMYDDWLLPASERHVKSALRLVNRCANIEVDDEALERTVDIYLHYAIFSTSIMVIAKTELAEMLFVGIHPFAASMCSAMVIGGALQGNPKCPAQNDIIQHKLVAVAVGAINGAVCCFVQSILEHVLDVHMGFGTLGTALALVINIAASSRYMCTVEGTVVRMLGIGKGESIFQDKVVEPQQCCCK